MELHAGPEEYLRPTPSTCKGLTQIMSFMGVMRLTHEQMLLRARSTANARVWIDGNCGIRGAGACRSPNSGSPAGEEAEARWRSSENGLRKGSESDLEVFKHESRGLGCESGPRV